MQPEGGQTLLVKGERQSTGLEIVRALSYAKGEQMFNTDGHDCLSRLSGRQCNLTRKVALGKAWRAIWLRQ